MLRDGELQAYLDGELTESDSARVEATLATDSDGKRRLEEIRAAAATFAGAVDAVGGVPAFRPAPPSIDENRRPATIVPFGWVSLARAAVLILAVAGVASAVIPGTPVHEWVSSLRIDQGPAPVAPGPAETTAVPVEATAAARERDPTSITIRPHQGAVSIRISPIPAGRTVRLVARLTAEPEARVSALGGRTPAYAVAPGAITVQGEPPKVLVVEIPHWVERASITVGEVVVVEKSGDRLVRTLDARALKSALEIDIQP